ncbi:MAG: MMPL family transporter [Panacagrimonas sp.]
MSPSLRGRFWLWSSAMLLMALWFAVGVRPNLRIETDILALLPADEHDAETGAALRAFGDTLSRRTLFLVGAPEAAQAREAARRFADSLRAAQAFEEVRLEVDGRFLDAIAVYREHRFQLLSPAMRERLSVGNTEPLFDQALRASYGPTRLPRPLPVAEDPLNLLGDFLAQSFGNPGAARIEGGMLMVSDAHKQYVLVSSLTSQSPFSMTAQQRLVAAIDTARTHATRAPDVEVIASGVLLHAAAAAGGATREINRVGTLGLAGVVLMIWFTFRSIRPLLLSGLVLGTGALAAIGACQLLFGRVHLITLVFGTGLIGVAIDYSNHFLADQFRSRDAIWSPRQAIRHVGPAIAVGMACAVLGYLALALAPLPGLRQMAVFCAVGLSVACASVLCWYPVLARPRSDKAVPLLLRLSQAADAAVGRLRDSPLAEPAFVLLLLASLFGLWRIEFADDIRLLQSSPAPLLADEQKVRERLQAVPDSRLFLVRGDSPAAVLETEEHLATQLDRLVQAGALGAYQNLARAVPSPRTQAANRELQAQQVYAPGGLAPRLLDRLGFPAQVRERSLSALDTSNTDPLQLEAWLQTAASEPYRHLWLGRVGRGYASVVSLVAVRDIEPLRALQIPGVRWVDRVAEISELLGRYRRLAGALIAGAYAVIGMLLALRYGMGQALRLIAVPVGAALATLALFGCLGIGASLFNVLALFLVLGLGVDYAVFLREGRQARAATTLALSLSTLGTALSYGLLAFSATPFIRSLGLTLLTGVALTFLFALLSERPLPSDST